MPRAEWTRTVDEPWRDERLIDGALDLAMDVRDIDAAALLEQLSKLPAETMLHLLLATAALVDVDQPVKDLLAWTDVRVGRSGWCSSGRHQMTGRNVAVQRNGVGSAPSRRCRACQRERASADRQRRQQVAS